MYLGPHDYIGVNQPYLRGSDPLFDAKFHHFPPFLGSLMPLKVLLWL